MVVRLVIILVLLFFCYVRLSCCFAAGAQMWCGSQGSPARRHSPPPAPQNVVKYCIIFPFGGFPTGVSLRRFRYGGFPSRVSLRRFRFGGFPSRVSLRRFRYSGFPSGVSLRGLLLRRRYCSPVLLPLQLMLDVALQAELRGGCAAVFQRLMGNCILTIVDF